MNEWMIDTSRQSKFLESVLRHVFALNLDFYHVAASWLEATQVDRKSSPSHFSNSRYLPNTSVYIFDNHSQYWYGYRER